MSNQVRHVVHRPVVDGTPKLHSGESNHPVKRIVVHSAVMPCERGRARQLGKMNSAGSTGGSWHYATDPGEAIQCSWDRFICHHAPPNSGSIGIEMADWPAPLPTGSRPKRWWANLKRSWRWATPNHRAMLKITAKLTAELLVQEGLPIQYRNAADLRAGARGWTTHAQVTKAFRQSVHWDPGLWPRRRFGRMVRRYAQDLQRS